MPAPQIIYQNWIGKKPEFSGKPEEDAESHLLSTRDWMEAHNFPEGDKVRHFCLMLPLVTYTKILPIVLPTCRPTSEPTYCPAVGQHVY